MKLFRSTMILTLVIGLALTMAACSGGKSPVDPGLATTNDNIAFGVPMDGSNIVAVYDAVIDPEAGTFTITPADRAGAFHFPLTQYYPNVLKIVGYGWTPNFWADMKLTHPYPGSGIKGYDARVIGIIPANAGKSFNYPTFNAIGNNSVVLEPDGYTKLFDPLGGSIVGNTNPFKAYFKSQPYRVWASTGTTTETQRWQMSLAGFGGPLQYKLVVDVSTNYPAAPQPIIDNAIEPVQITPSVGTGLTTTGGSATVNVTLIDWQGPGGGQGIGCAIEAPALFTGSVNLPYVGPGPNPNEFIFSGPISNTKLAVEGDYKCMVAGWDIEKSIYMYVETTAHVTAVSTGAWKLDANRTNKDMSAFDMPPDKGSDLAVIDQGDPVIDGVLFIFASGHLCLADLNLTNSIEYGYGYYPWDQDPANPHPTPTTVMPCVRIDSNNNGATLRTFNDPHKGLAPGDGTFHRNDCICLIEAPAAGFLESITGLYFRLTTDDPATTVDERTERFKCTEVWDEADIGSWTYPLGAFWSGTVIKDASNTWFMHGIVGTMNNPYFDGAAFVWNWGPFHVTNPPMNEVVGIDASQNTLFPYQYWAYSGPAMGPGLVAMYSKDFLVSDSYLPTSTTAKILDLELIPLQTPPLVVNNITQSYDWIAILLDDQTIEIIDPSVTGGQSVEVINCSSLTGDVKYLDIADKSASIFVSHTDGTKAYCSVYKIR